MARLLFTVALALAFSCTILEQSDITSRDELRELRLKDIAMTQVLNSGTTTKVATVIDEEVDLDTQLGKVTRRIRIAWPDVDPANSKFQFRSGITSEIEIRLFIGIDRQIRYCFVNSAGVNFEAYYFDYNTGGKLEGLTASISQNGLDFVTTTDQYDPPGELFAIRGSADPSKRGILGGDPVYVNSCVWKQVYRYTWSSGNFLDAKQYNFCNSDNFYIEPGGQSADFYVIGDELIEEVYIANRRTPSDAACCLDKYYFHPYLFVPVDYKRRIMYAQDWWDEEGSFTVGNDESVKLNFNYGH